MLPKLEGRVLDPVGSTSWHNRHLEAFRRLDEILRAEGPDDLTIMIVGPGGVTRVASPLLSNSAERGVPRLRRLIGDLARYSDQVLRRIPLMPLRSLEPVEVSRCISRPHHLVVVDRSHRVLTAVERDLPDSLTRCVDLSFQPISLMADVVIAFNVVCRLEEKAPNGMKFVTDAVRPRGWLLIDDRSAANHLGPYQEFVRVAPKIFRRAARLPAGNEAPAR